MFNPRYGPWNEDPGPGSRAESVLLRGASLRNCFARETRRIYIYIYIYRTRGAEGSRIPVFPTLAGNHRWRTDREKYFTVPLYSGTARKFVTIDPLKRHKLRRDEKKIHRQIIPVKLLCVHSSDGWQLALRSRCLTKRWIPKRRDKIGAFELNNDSPFGERRRESVTKGEGTLSRIETGSRVIRISKEGIRENKSKQRVTGREDRAESRTEEADKW